MNTWHFTADLRPSAARSIRRAGAAIGAAVSIHAAILWGLVALNTRPVPDPLPELPVRTILLAADRAPAPPPPKPEPEQPAPRQLEPVTIHLDALTPPALEPIDMQLDLPAPTLSPIRINIRPQPSPVKTPVLVTTPAAPSGPIDAAQVDQPPRELSDNPQPRYPQRERRLGLEASVTVRVFIDTHGRVEDVKVVHGPSAFADAVVEAVRRWRFAPAQDHGRPVKVWGIKTFRFELQE